MFSWCEWGIIREGYTRFLGLQRTAIAFYRQVVITVYILSVYSITKQTKEPSIKMVRLGMTPLIMQ